LTVSRGTRGFESWDLTKLRRELVALGLDWDAEPLSLSVASPSSLSPATNDIARDSMSTQAEELFQVSVDQGEYEFYTNVRREWGKYVRRDSETKSDDPDSMANQIYGLGQLHVIATMCNSAIRDNPQYAWAYSMRARANSELNRHVAAIKDWERAVALFPNPEWNEELSRLRDQHAEDNGK